MEETISPSITGLRLNCRRCGSSRAPKNPIDALVAIILNEHTKMLGIFSNVTMDAERIKANFSKDNGIDFFRISDSTRGDPIYSFVQQEKSNLLFCSEYTCFCLVLPLFYTVHGIFFVLHAISRNYYSTDYQ